jgi:hypothetical protein
MIYLDQGINILEWMVEVLPRPWVSLERFGSSLNLLELKMQLLGKIAVRNFWTSDHNFGPRNPRLVFPNNYGP